MGNFDCEMAVPARPLQCLPLDDRTSLPILPLGNGERYRLRVVNTGSLTGFSLKIANTTLLPFQVDGGNEITPAAVQGMGIIYPGERVDAVLQTGMFDGPRFLEVQMDDENFKFPNPALDPEQSFPVKALSSSPSSKGIGPPQFEYYNLQAALTEPNSNILQPKASLKFVLYTTTLKLAKHHNIPMGFINHTSWSPQSSPPEPLVALSREQFDKNQFCPHIPLFHNDTASDSHSDGWIEIVINNLDDGGHPFHLHGYSFYVVSVFPHPLPWSSDKPPFTRGGSGMYNYNPFTTKPQDSPAGEYNLLNPMMKDTVFVPQRGYAVIRLRADNPGIWMMHCHVGWHLGSGMAMGWEVA
jgi:FtsP/CotA-like multicopper oxidase with cupredoxin domain